jgi:hypothetical protein
MKGEVYGKRDLSNTLGVKPATTKNEQPTRSAGPKPARKKKS